MKKNKLPSLIAILILTLITVIMWVSLGIYRALTQKSPASVPQEITNQLTPTLDTDSLGKIQSRILIDDSQIPEIVITKSPAPVASTPPIPTATPSPGEIPSPTPATNSGVPL